MSVKDKEYMLNLIHNAAACAITADPDNEETIKAIYEPRLKHFSDLITQKIGEI